MIRDVCRARGRDAMEQSSGHTRYPDIKDASFVHFISDGRTDLSAQMHIVE